jgi:uncharacterized protein (TIGR03437 family)
MRHLQSLVFLLPVIAAAQSGSATAITTRVSAILSAGANGGTQGLYLKQVSGSVLANQQERFAFDPGTAASIVPALYAVRLVQNGTLNFDSPVTHYDNPPAGCPNPNFPVGTESLRTALSEMMWHSDTARTHALQTTFGRTNLDNFARSIGMTSTNLPLIPGCVTANAGRLTLADAATLYEGVLDASLLASPQRYFLDLLPGKSAYTVGGSDPEHIWDSDIPRIVRQEAPAGTTAAQLATYQASIDVGYKSGATVVCVNTDCTRVLENYSVSGWARVPFCGGNQTLTRVYTFGVFIANAPDDAWFSGKQTAAAVAFAAARAELLREQLRTGLASCFSPNPMIVSPTPGSVLKSKTVTFAWSSGTNWDGYRLDIGTEPGKTDYASIVTSTPLAIVTNLPCDGRVLGVRLWAHGPTGYINSSDYAYTACTNGGPQITSPSPGANLASSSITFTWTAVSGADLYRLEVGTAPQARDLGVYSIAGLSATVNNLPTDGRTIYVSITAHTAAGFRTPNDYAFNNLVGQTPIVTSVVNAASRLPSLSPVCLAVMTGSGFSAGATVSVGNVRAVLTAPPTANEITFLIPPNVAVGPTTVTVTSGAATSAPFPIRLIDASPGLYSRFVDSTGAAIDAGHPAKPGQLIGALAVGMGPVDTNGQPLFPFGILVGSGNTPATVDSIASPSTPGVFQVNFRVPPGLAGGAQPVTVVIGKTSSNTAQLVVAGPFINSILNGASFATNAKVAPGSIVSLFGSDLAVSDRFNVFPSASLPGGGGIAFNGSSAPLFDVVTSVGQINLLVPFELPTDGNVSVVLSNSAGTSMPFTLAMAPAAPGIFRLFDPADNRRSSAAVLLANTAWRVIPDSLATTLGFPHDCKANGVSPLTGCGQPASPGDVVQIYATGLGRATPNGNPAASTLRTGDVAPANASVLYRTLETPEVTIGGVPAVVDFSGMAPGFAGLYQVNVKVPDDAPGGDDVPLKITIGGASDTATIAIRRP